MPRSFLLISALIVSGAMGAGARDGEGTFISPRELPDSVIVTANRFGSTEARSVWPTEVLTVDNGAAAPSLDSRLDGEAGVDIRNYNGPGSVATLSNWGVFNRHMLLLYNGRAVKDYSLGGFNLADFSPNELARIEIVKGPQSAFYGSDAVGGVVNLITRTSLVDHLEARTRVGSFGAQSYFVDASRRRGNLGFGAWAEYAATDNRRANAGADRIIGGVRSDFLSGDHHVSLSARYFEDSLGVPGPTPEAAYIPVYGDAESSSLTSHQTDRNYSVDLQYRFANARLGDAQLDLFWEKKNLDYRTLYNYQAFYTTIDSSGTLPDTSLNIDSVDTHSHTVYNKRSAGLSGRYLRELGPLALAGGLDFLSGSLRTTNDDRSDGFNIVGPFAPYAYDYASYTFWSASQDQFDLWGSTRWSIAPTLQLDLSGRLQLVNDRKTQPSYNLGLIVTPRDDLRLKLGYAFAFRLPSLAEQFADDLFTQGNASLSAETARTLAFTVSFDPKDLPLSVRATLFHQEVDSLIQYVWDPSIFRSVPENFERFTSTGLDLGADYRFPHNLTLSLSGVYQQAEQTAQNGDLTQAAPYVPELKSRLALVWGRGRLNAGANVTYTSTRGIYLYDGSRKEIERVYEFGLRSGLRINDRVRLSLSGDDLSDERRADQFGFTSADRDYPGLGRRFSLEAVITIM